MNTGKTLFAQLMDFLPWSTFTRLVARYHGDRGVRTLPCTEQYQAMAFAQLTYRSRPLGQARGRARWRQAVITVPAGIRIYLAMGPTDMRKGFDGLSVLAQEALKQDPFSGSFFIFRGKRGDLVNVLYWDGQGWTMAPSVRSR
jgi:hypothetical protein